MADLSRRMILLTLPAFAFERPARAGAPDAATRAFADLERRAGGRLGVAAWRHGGAPVLAWRADEWFPFCSTA